MSARCGVPLERTHALTPRGHTVVTHSHWLSHTGRTPLVPSVALSPIACQTYAALMAWLPLNSAIEIRRISLALGAS